MNCRKFQYLFSAFLDGELEGGIKTEAEEHLGLCRQCSRLVEAHRAGIGRLSLRPLIAPPADLFEKVMSSVEPEAARPRVHESRYIWRPRVLVPAFAALVVVLALGLLMDFNNKQSPEFQNYALVDSTMDVINYQVAEQLAKKEGSPEMKAVHLASFARIEEEMALNNGVSHNPVLVLSGVEEKSE